MSYSAIRIANEFIYLSLKNGGIPINALRLNKLVFIAHGFYLYFYNKPLIYSDIHKFNYGPVIPVLYTEVRKHGINPIYDYLRSKTYKDYDCELDEKIKELINIVFQRYNLLSDLQLTSVIMNSKCPWFNQTNYSVIPNFVIKDHYKGLCEKASLKILKEDKINETEN